MLIKLKHDLNPLLLMLSSRPLLLLLLILLLTGCALVSDTSQDTASAAAPNGKEIRAIWVTRWDFHTPEDIRKIMRNAASIGCNRVFLQVRGEGTCFFKSRVEPWAWELTGDDPSTTGRDPGWDPLKTAIQEAHAAGIELHAYMNVLPSWNSRKMPPRNIDHPINTHRDWFMVGESGRPMTPPVEDCYPFLNPALPEVRAHLVRVFGDVARNYPGLDGIHLDYIRYPGDVGMYSYDRTSLVEFRAYSNGRSPKDAPAEWTRWRSSRINLLLAEIGREVRTAQPKLEFSAAVLGDYPSAYEENAQNWLAWLDVGLIDTIVTMSYQYDETKYRNMIEFPLAEHHPKKGQLVIGVFPQEAWRKSGKYTFKTLSRQIDLARQMGADGIALFSYAIFFPHHEPNEWAAYVRNNCFNKPVASPKQSVSQTRVPAKAR
ncbi:TPA: hypothetical protein DDW35_03330 [Candidatus Sumerlaeota bacterium]|jgi:uncharacterized lipoprotein YddW (UPF0748 family)|nr:hypothetical protein [Candidatus Sumerlaeota bacterium]